MCLFFFLLFSAFISFLYFKLILPFNYWTVRGVSQVNPNLRFIKSFFCLSNESFSDIFRSMYTAHPDLRYFGTFISTRPALFLRDLDLIKQVTIKNFEFFSDRMDLLNNAGTGTNYLLPLSLFALTRQKWRHVRSVLSPAFTSSKIKAMSPFTCDTARSICTLLEEELVKNNKEVLELEIKDFLEKYSIDVTIKGYFGIDQNCLKNGESTEFLQIGRMFMKPPLWTVVKAGFFLLFPRLFAFFRIEVIPLGVTRKLFEEITKAIKFREDSNLVRSDVLQLLIEAKSGKLKQMSIENVKETSFAAVEEYESSPVAQSGVELTTKMVAAQAGSLFFSAFSTTSSFIEFFVYELAINPQVQQKLQNEIDEYGDEEISYEMLTKMKYLDQTVCEVLRKWSVAYVTSRVCTKNFIIEPKQAGEKPLLIEKGCTILVPILAIHSDPDFFPEPEKLDPERFNEENKSKTISGSFIPFGTGPRNCIASRFALLVVKAMVVNLFSKFDVIPVDKTQIPLQVANRLLVEPKRNLWFGLRKRF